MTDAHASSDWTEALIRSLEIDVRVQRLTPSPPGRLRTVYGRAARLRQEICELQPVGPYRLAGCLVDGLLAYEVATQLLGLDQAVEFVGLIGTRVPAGGRDGHDAEWGYTPRPIPVPVHLFVPSQPDGSDPFGGWAELMTEDQLVTRTLSGGGGSSLEGIEPADLGGAVRAAIAGSPGMVGARLEPGSSLLLRLRVGNPGGGTLLCVPGAGASVVSFHALAGRLDPAWSVFGLQPRGLQAGEVPHASVPAAAASLLAAARGRLGPRDPLHLLGHSFGGWIAFEVARALRSQGRAVSSLTLLDVRHPMEDGSGPIEYDDREALDALVRVFALTSGRTFRFDASLVGQCSADRLAELERRLVEWGIVPRSSPGVMQAVFRAFATCLRTPYRPTAAYPDPVSLVLVHDPEVSEEENLRRFDRTARGWELWAPRLAVSIAGGNHMTVLNEPHVQSLASLLEQQATPDEMEPEC